MDVAEDVENQLDGEGDKRRGVGMCQGNKKHLGNDLAQKAQILVHVLRHGNFLRDIIEGKLMGKATHCRKR